MPTRNNERVRFRYGICLNDKCEKCKSKEVQEIPARKDFVCQNPECGKPLRECPPPKKGGKGKLIAIIAAIAILAAIGGIIAFSGSGGNTEAEEPQNVASAPQVNEDSLRAAQMEAENQRLRDSLVAAQAAEEEARRQAEAAASQPAAAVPVPTTPRASSGTKNLGYATFKGSWPSDVNGRMVFTTSHVIDSRDPNGRMAEPGDYVIGEWVNGHLVQGIWYGADNQVKGSVIIGQ